MGQICNIVRLLFVVDIILEVYLFIKSQVDEVFVGNQVNEKLDNRFQKYKVVVVGFNMVEKVVYLEIELVEVMEVNNMYKLQL